MLTDNLHTICLISAMQAEAQPIIDSLSLHEVPRFFSPFPCRLFEGETQGKRLSLALNGQLHGTDLVGCEPATLTATLATMRLNPDLIVNPGTCGAFSSKGATIGQAYIGSSAMFHDRRVPGDDDWGTQSLGNYPAWEGSETLAERLELPTGKVTTGSSLDMQPCDLDIITLNGGELKDMEGAAIGFVCSLSSTPVLYIKAVTDLLDGGQKTLDEFRRNLSLASRNLCEATLRAIALLSGSPQA